MEKKQCSSAVSKANRILGMIKRNFVDRSAARGVYPSTTMTQTFPPSTPSSTLPSFFFPSSPLSRGSGGMTPENVWNYRCSYRRVLEHFAHKNQHLYEPGFLTGSCKFRISSKCACSIVNR